MLEDFQNNETQQRVVHTNQSTVLQVCFASCVLRVSWVFSRDFLHNFASKYEYMKSFILIKIKQNTTRNVMLKSINHSKTERNYTVKRNLDGHSHHLKS